jgi:hypothetical protein
MKVTFSLTVTDVNCHDENTAKEILAAFLQSGLNVRVDDINILALDSDDDISDDDQLHCDAAEFSYHEIEADFNPEEQTKHMED